MKKLGAIILIFLISIDTNANENCNSNDPDLTALCNTLDDGSEILETMLALAALGAVVYVATSATALGEAVQDSENSIAVEFTGDKIVFNGSHKLKNLEINFSNPVRQNQYQQFFQINEDHYIGITWRF